MAKPGVKRRGAPITRPMKLVELGSAKSRRRTARYSSYGSPASSPCRRTSRSMSETTHIPCGKASLLCDPFIHACIYLVDSCCALNLRNGHTGARKGASSDHRSKAMDDTDLTVTLHDTTRPEERTTLGRSTLFQAGLHVHVRRASPNCRCLGDAN